jgi:hypothetical protein
MPVFHSGWELCRLHKNLRKVIRASYKTYLLWRVGVIVATKCHMNVFRILFQKRFMENLSLKETLLVFLGTNASGSQDVQAKRMVKDRAKMDMSMYQLVREYLNDVLSLSYSMKQRHCLSPVHSHIMLVS